MYCIPFVLFESLKQVFILRRMDFPYPNAYYEMHFHDEVIGVS